MINTPYVQRLGLEGGPIARWGLRGRRIKRLMRIAYGIRFLRPLQRTLFREGDPPSGDGDCGYRQVGRIVGSIHAVEPVAEIVERFPEVAGSDGACRS